MHLDYIQTWLPAPALSRALHPTFLPTHAPFVLSIHHSTCCFPWKFYSDIYLVWLSACVNTCMRTTFRGVSSETLSCGFWGLNSGHQAWGKHLYPLSQVFKNCAFIYFMCVDIFVSTYATCKPGAFRVQKPSLDPLNLESQTVVSCHRSAGNCPRSSWKAGVLQAISPDSLLSHCASPNLFIYLFFV